MSDYDDRGAYTPPSDRLAFDPRTPVRGGGPAPVTLIVSGAVLVGLVGGVFFLYRDGFKHRGGPPALVGAPVADVRTAAAPPVGPADNGAAQASLVVDKNIAPPPAPAFAPPPAAALPAQQAAAAPPSPQATLPPPPVVASANPPAPAPASVAVADKPPAPQVVMLSPDASPKPAAAPRQLVVATPPRAAAATTHVAAAPSLRQAAAAPTERAVARHSTMTIASLADDALSRHPRAARVMRDDGASRDDTAARPVRRTSVRFIEAPPAAPPAHRATIKGAQYAAAPPVRAPAPPPTRITAPPVRLAAASGSGWVQIGAFSSPSLADQGWRDIAHLEPGAMAGKGKMVQPVDRDDGTTLYRTYVTGFASVSAAQSFCAELKASGKACMVK